MILDYWKPKRRKREIIYYYQINPEEEVLNTNVRVRWKCDNPECKYKDKIYSISYHHLIGRNSKTCNENIQICKSCQNRKENNPMWGKTHSDDVKNKLSQISFKKYNRELEEKYGVSNCSCLEEIKKKKGQIILRFETISNLLWEEGYRLLDIDGENQHSMLKIECPNGHVFEMKYQSWRAGHRCIKCHYDSLKEKGIHDLEGYELYRRLVYQYTNQNYRKYKDKINPQNLERGRGKNHLDHKFSICEGFKNGVLPCIIGNHVNLELITETENTKKQEKCSIDKEKLFNEYYKQN